MSALSVCSGTIPSAYPSDLAISAPPKRPETIVLTPLAPALITLWIARFCATLNDALCSNCSAILLATKVASKSGFPTSTTLI